MGTKDLIAHYADSLKATSDLPLPRQTAAHLARVIGQLREDGLSEEDIKLGLDVLVEKGLTPGALAGAVIEAAHRRGPSRGSFVCTQPGCGLAFKTADRLAEHRSDVHWLDD